MKKLRRFLFTFALCLSMLSVLPVSQLTVLAAEETSAQTTDESVEVFDTGNAISDIMTDSRFKGAISSISKITEFVDIWFVRIISLVSFFIISAALLKNACAGAYCANSKFWDKVADAHQKTDALNIAGIKNYFQGGQGIMNTTPGGIRDFFLGIIPNIKAFTDFDDADIEPKAYFMKAIPQMIACVIIGIFIYNGYYRDTAATVGEMGSVLIERTLGSVNPDSFVNKIFNTTGWPKSPWDKDHSRAGEWKQAIFKELKSLVASNYPDVTSSGQKADAVKAIVNQVNSCGVDAYVDSAGDGFVYKMSGISSYVSTSTPDIESYQEDGAGNINALLKFDMNSICTSTSMNYGNNTAYVSFTLKKVVDDDKAGASNVDVDGWGAVGAEGKTLELSSDTAFISLPAGASVADGKITLTGPAYVPVSNFTETPISKLGTTDTMGLQLVTHDNVKCIQIRQGTYVLTDGKLKLAPLIASSNRGSSTSAMTYVGFQ